MWRILDFLLYTYFSKCLVVFIEMQSGVDFIAEDSNVVFSAHFTESSRHHYVINLDVMPNPFPYLSFHSLNVPTKCQQYR